MKISSHLLLVGLSIASLNLSAAAAKPAKDAALKCEITIDATDQMQYQLAGKKLDSMTVPLKCKHFTVVLKHIGQLPKEVMGHNFVVTAATDAQVVVDEAIKLGPAKDYLPDMNAAPFKAKIIAMGDKLLKGGESEEIKIETSKLKKGGDYMFFCTFPGHFTLMQGKLIVN